MTEAAFQQQVIELAQLLGYRVAHFRPARTEQGWRTPVAADGKGFPDLVLVGHGRVIFAELKSDRGRLTGDQEVWLYHLAQTPAEAYCWRPTDFDEIQEVLRAGR